MRILDTTLRDGLLAESIRLNVEDKIKIATLLDRAGIEIIEIAHAHGADLKEEIDVGMELSSCKACVLTDTDPDNIKQALDFIGKIKGGVIHIYSMADIAVHELTGKCQEIQRAIRYAREHAEAVQWTGFDANRASYAVFQKQIETAIQAGAQTITIPDSMGVEKPAGFNNLVKKVISDFKSDQIAFSVHCHDDLGHALENTLAGIRSGVQQAEATVRGIGARKGNCALLPLIRAKGLLSQYGEACLNNVEHVLETVLKKR